MAVRPWVDELVERLAGRGLPPVYVQRFVEELSDHVQDLMEETMSTESEAWTRLGEPDQVAEAAVLSFRRRTFVGRHPAAAFLVFTVLPLVSVCALSALMLQGVFWVETIHTWFAGELDLRQVPPAVLKAVPGLLSLWTIILPTVLVSVVSCRLVLRWGLSRKWMMVSCVLLALLALNAAWSLQVSEIPGQSAVRLTADWPSSVGEGVGSLLGQCQKPVQLMQLLAPVLVAGWFLWRTRKQMQTLAAPKKPRLAA